MSLYELILKVLNKLHFKIIFYILYHLFKVPFINSYIPNPIVAKKIIRQYKNNRTLSLATKKKIKISNKNKIIKKWDLQIIVPVYNSEEYINRCLKSILNQKTQYSFQVIVINDGSTDNTSHILKKYENNPYIKIIHQHNLGRSCARNTGLNYATNSEYLMFVDSDDFIASNAIEKLLNEAYGAKSDIIFGGYDIFYKKHIIKQITYPNNNIIKLNSINDINGYIGGKVFKNSLFSKIRFPRGYEFEDTILAFWIYPRCYRISSINATVYFYRYNPKSISHNIRHDNICIDSFLITVYILKRLSYYGIHINQYIYNTFLVQVKMNCLRNIYIKNSIQKSIFVLSCKLYDKYFRNYSTNMSRFKFLEFSLKNKNYNNYILSCIMK